MNLGRANVWEREWRMSRERETKINGHIRTCPELNGGSREQPYIVQKKYLQNISNQSPRNFHSFNNTSTFYVSPTASIRYRSIFNPKLDLSSDIVYQENPQNDLSNGIEKNNNNDLEMRQIEFPEFKSPYSKPFSIAFQRRHNFGQSLLDSLEKKKFIGLEKIATTLIDVFRYKKNNPNSTNDVSLICNDKYDTNDILIDSSNSSKIRKKGNIDDMHMNKDINIGALERNKNHNLSDKNNYCVNDMRSDGNKRTLGNNRNQNIRRSCNFDKDRSCYENNSKKNLGFEKDLNFDNGAKNAESARDNKFFDPFCLNLLEFSRNFSKPSKLLEIERKCALLELEEKEKPENDANSAIRSEFEPQKNRIAKKLALLEPSIHHRPVPPADESEILKILDLLSSGSSRVLVSNFGQDLTSKDLMSLIGKNWLNDEIINFWTSLVHERTRICREKNLQAAYNWPNCHHFNSFFWSILSNEGKKYSYDKVKNWTRKIDIFSLEKVILPVHLGSHWCVAVVNFKEKRFEYYDSLGGSNPQCLQYLRMWIQDEWVNKKYSKNDSLEPKYNLDPWHDYVPHNIPHQVNGYDCGVFSSMYIDYLSKDAQLDFDQSDMPNLRYHMLLSIFKKSLPCVEFGF